MTLFVQQLMRERGEPVPPEQSLETAKRIKEKYSYVCPDIVKEFKKYDTEPNKWIKMYQGIHNITKQPWQCDVAYEKFLAPEIFFSPEIYSSDYLTPLPILVDDTIQACPIDSRRSHVNFVYVRACVCTFVCVRARVCHLCRSARRVFLPVCVCVCVCV